MEFFLWKSWNSILHYFYCIYKIRTQQTSSFFKTLCYKRLVNCKNTCIIHKNKLIQIQLIKIPVKRCSFKRFVSI